MPRSNKSGSSAPKKKPSANDSAPRPAPEPTLPSVEVTSVGPAVPDLSLLLPNAASSVHDFLVPQLHSSQSHPVPGASSQHPTGAIPKRISDGIKKKCPTEDLKLEKIIQLSNLTHNDPNESVLFIRSVDAAPCDHNNAAMSAASILGMLSEGRVPPEPMIFLRQSQPIQPSVPEVSVFDSNNNAPSNVSGNMSEGHAQECCPDRFGRTCAFNSGKRMRQRIEPAQSVRKVKYVTQFHKATQTTPDLCDKWTQVSFARRKDENQHMDEKDFVISGTSGENLTVASYAHLAQILGFVDPTQNTVEREVTKQMLMKALDELNNMFSFPAPGEECVENLNIGIPNCEGVRAFVKKKSTCESKPSISQINFESPTERSAMMRELARKYLPELKQNSIFETKPGDETKDVHTGSTFKPPYDCKKYAAVNDAVKKRNQSSATDKTAETVQPPAPFLYETKADKIEVKEIFPPPRARKMRTTTHLSGVATYSSGTDAHSSGTSAKSSQTYAPNKDISGREGCSEKDKISNLPIALCREEKELLLAFRQHQIIMIVKPKGDE